MKGRLREFSDALFAQLPLRVGPRVPVALQGLGPWLSPEEPKLRALLAYWQDKRAGRPMPARADIDPVEIPALLPHLMLIETAERLDDFRYRLCGTEVCCGFRRDQTGCRFSDAPRIANYEKVYEGYWRTYAEKQPQYFRGRVFTVARSHVCYSRLMLPLSADGIHVNMLLGGVVFSSARGLGPI
jgi:hypothetical protein